MSIRSITAADITVLAPDFYTAPHHTRYLRRSARRIGVPIRFYGTGEPYRGWMDVQVYRLIEELERVATRYFLYTDSSDAIFVRDLDEVAYALKGGPDEMIIMSVEHDDQLCAGGWLAHTGLAIDALRWLADASFTGDESNPQERWREAVREGTITDVTLDIGRHIFQVVDEDLNVVQIGDRPPVVANPRTNSLPCVLHWAGGYTDPVIGKAAVIEPMWHRLGYEELS